MEYLKLNNDVEMPIEGLGTFLIDPGEARKPQPPRSRLATSTSTPPTPT